VRRLPGPAGDGLSDGGNSRGSHRFVSGLAENTNSIFCADSSESQTANGCPVLRRAGTTSREAKLRNGGYLIRPMARSLERAQKSCAFLLTMTYMDARHPGAMRSLRLAFYPTLNPYFAAWVCRSFHFAVVLEPDGPAPLSACTAPNTLPAF
jgi:hypothetical protein